jgi:hypothetical protein
MKSKWSSLIFKGKLTVLGVFILVATGFLMSYLSLEFLPYRWMRLVGLSVGLGLAAIGGFSGRAKALGLPPPFTNDPLGWRAAKKSYDKESTRDEDRN